MLSVDIMGFGALRLAHLVLDYNGTLAIDGILLPGVKERLRRLAADLRVHILTADTFGKARAELQGIRCELAILETQSQDRAKAAYVRRLGADNTACVGNGRNDRLMLRVAALGIAVIQGEGASPVTVLEADIVVNNVSDALDLLLNPLRLVAGLRR
jgi:soluble P-type ATPase